MFRLPRVRISGLRKTPTFFGAVAGAQIGAYVLGVLVLFAAAAATNAQSGTSLPCMMKTECINTTEANRDNCDREHCWQVERGCPGGQGRCYVNPPPANLSVAIGGATRVLDVGDYIAKVYNYTTGVVALVAAVIFMIGGFQWLTAGGDSAKVGKAKERIRDALIGLLLVLGAMVILRTINPDILSLQMPKIAVVKKKTFVECSLTELCHPCGTKYYILKKKSGGAGPGGDGDCASTAVDPVPEAKLREYTVSNECIGKSCSKIATACGDSNHRCTSDVAAGAATECAASGGTPSGGGTAGTNSATGSPSVYGEQVVCRVCKQSGEPCSSTGSNDQCCGGFCADTTTGNFCSSGQPGETCDNNRQCRSGICQTNWLNRCSSGGVGAPCASDQECARGFKCSTLGHNTCSPGTMYSYCDEDSECQAGLRCISPGTGAVKVCYDAATLPEIETCSVSACPAGQICQTNYRNFCTFGRPGSPCAADSECSVANGSKGCAVGTGLNVCVAGALGDLCDAGRDCQSGRCGCTPSTGPFAALCICTTGGPGSPCQTDGDCDSNQSLRCISTGDTGAKRCLQS